MLDDSSKKPVPAPAAAEPDKLRPIGAWQAILGVFLAFAGSQLISVFAIYFIAGQFFATRYSLDAWISSVPGGFCFVLVTEATAMLILWLLLRRRMSLKAVGFGRQPKWADWGKALLAALVYFAILIAAVALAQSLLHIDTDAKQELGFDAVSGYGSIILTYISLVILPPIAEEVMFRGVLYGGLRSKLPFITTALLTSAVFALPHIYEGSSGILWIAGIDTFILSLVLCYLREKTGALWASIGLHMIKNSVAFLALYHSAFV